MNRKLSAQISMLVELVQMSLGSDDVDDTDPLADYVKSRKRNEQSSQLSTDSSTQGSTIRC